MTAILLEAQIACIERELIMRRRLYPVWVQQRRMPQSKADAEISTMEAVLATLQALVPPPAQGGLL